MLKSFLEPVESQEDDECVDSDWIGQHREEKYNDLLVGIELIEIECVEPALGTGATGKE